MDQGLRRADGRVPEQDQEHVQREQRAGGQAVQGDAAVHEAQRPHHHLPVLQRPGREVGRARRDDPDGPLQGPTPPPVGATVTGAHLEQVHSESLLNLAGIFSL